MPSLAIVRQIILAIDNAKNHKDNVSANRGFIGLLHAILSENVESGYSLLFQQGSHPYFDVIVIALEDVRIRMPRPLLALKPFESFFELSIEEQRPSERQSRPDCQYQDCSHSIDAFGLTVPEGWLLEAKAPCKQWMSADDIAHCGYWDYANRQPAFNDREEEVAED